MNTYLQAVLLGVIEGLTEFLPVSSTGHMILLGDLLGFHEPEGETFKIVIQLGAILALCVVYWQRLWTAAIGVTNDPRERAFVRNILIAFLPAAVIGALAHKYISALLHSPMVVAVALVVGGLVILILERLVRKPRFFNIADFPLLLSLLVGFFQCIAMIPGVSRSGATIMGSLMVGVERRTAAEFSFFLAIPTMLGASVFSLYKNWSVLSFSQGEMILTGFVTAFLVALVVVKGAVAFVGRHGFAPFAWYRILVGGAAIVFLLMR